MSASATPEPAHVLCVLVANEQDDRLQSIASIVEALSHDVVGRDTNIENVGSRSRSTNADVALVGLGLDSEHALEQITAIVHEAACPVIALLDAEGPFRAHRQAPVRPPEGF